MQKRGGKGDRVQGKGGQKARERERDTDPKTVHRHLERWGQSPEGGQSPRQTDSYPRQRRGSWSL